MAGITDATNPLPSSPSEEKLIYAPNDGQYKFSTLSRASLSPSPFHQFHHWFQSAQSFPIPQPETTVFSTASLPSGRISARTVYLKQLDTHGFVVFTNLGTSRKSRDLKTNPHAALTFHWAAMERQVRVEGVVEYLTREENQAYYDTRIRGSRIGAWASRQSCELSDRGELERRVKEAEERFDGVEEIPVPEFWGGVRIRPLSIEFWQGRESRLHDRFIYEREDIEKEEWTVKRLSP
ncbi:pyridoxamine 5'-phosphate oxidase [Ascodesmis nigricans]|uniref:pyridoxal 5'-phosphate synthase n=1 Tax=Ascodesmis nigricans TaxID=341454 RepID=A0A4S2N7A4_9PEZI|nr:pyridoxamine 5'-phosphate oxidase [Ascodesmis nigricans]